MDNNQPDTEPLPVNVDTLREENTEPEKPEPRSWRLRSSPLFHVPGMIINWRHMTRTGERRLAMGQMMLAFPQLPGALIIDILDGRVEIKSSLTNAWEDAEFVWDAPMGEASDYIYEWQPLTHSTAGSKLEWIEMMLGAQRIPCRRVVQPDRVTPRLEVPQDKHEEAHRILHARIRTDARRLTCIVRDLPDEHAVFIEDGPAWDADNVEATQ